jgi:GNAT superfamily N-acetyltransferase
VNDWARADGYCVSDDKSRLDLDRVYRWIAVESYWAQGMPREIFERSVAGAWCFGVYAPNATQVGFARCITDRATFGYLGDVYVDKAHRGKGLAKFLVATILAHPALQGFRRWSLVTSDSQTLYAKFGFAPVAEPHRHMEMRAIHAYV